MERYKKSHISTIYLIGPTWNEEFELPVGLYYISDIKDYLKKHSENTDNPSIRIYLKKN